MIDSYNFESFICDPGWHIIDSACINVQGDLSNIVSYMETVLNSYDVRNLCSKLGLASTGFLFWDELKQETMWFGDNKELNETYKTPYSWSDLELSTKWSGLVHELFLHVRKGQHKRANNRNDHSSRPDKILHHYTDYFRNIPKDKNIEYWVPKNEEKFRQSYSIHYVSLGEMLFTMYAWRYLLIGKFIYGGDANIDDIELSHDYFVNSNETCQWDNINLLDRSLATISIDTKVSIENAWKSIFPNNITDIKRELDVLCIGEDSKKSSLIARDAIFNFINFIRPSDIVNKQEYLINGKINECIIRLIKLLSKSIPEDINQGLQYLEQNARFPILPFYFWSALDNSPKCYLVAPVWTSQRHRIIVGNNYCRHLGLALSAVSPMSSIDWTLPKIEFKESIISNADILALTNLIKLMAKPLVEHSLYDAVYKYNEIRNDISAIIMYGRMLIDEGEISEENLIRYLLPMIDDIHGSILYEMLNDQRQEKQSILDKLNNIKEESESKINLIDFIINTNKTSDIYDISTNCVKLIRSGRVKSMLAKLQKQKTY